MTDPWAGSDQRYLLDTQYRNAEKLVARASLHARYRTAAVAWFPWLADQVPWPADASVLEVGCGPGWFWAEAASSFPANLHLTLTDISAGMLLEALERIDALGQFGVTGREVNAQQLPFDDNSFDVVVANHMLYHVPQPGVAVMELARVLRPGGSLLAAANGPGNMIELQRLRSSTLGTTLAEPMTERFGSVSGLPLLEGSFSRVEWRPYEDELRCTDADDVVAYMTSWPPGDSATTEQISRLRDTVEAVLDANEGVFTVSKDTGAFVAIR